MPNVFDNIDNPFLENEAGNGLKDALKVAKRGDFCVGYFNLRGWRCIDSVVNAWHLPPTHDSPPPCRLLVGMQRLPHEQLRAWLGDSTERPPDLGQLAKLRKDAAKEFRKQLTIGFPTDQDEAGLRRLVGQLREKRLVVTSSAAPAPSSSRTTRSHPLLLIPPRRRRRKHHPPAPPPLRPPPRKLRSRRFRRKLLRGPDTLR